MFSILSDTYKKTGVLHHAYIVEGGEGEAISLRETLEGIWDVILTGNPDVFSITVKKFGIDESRELKGWQSKRAISQSSKCAIVIAGSISDEAQNALLKTFEEPTAGSHFFIILPSLVHILDTLKSRVVIIEPKVVEGGVVQLNDFLALKPAERLKQIERFTKKINDDEDRHEQRAKAIVFCKDLLKYVYNCKSSNRFEALEMLKKTIEYLESREVGVKMIMEHLALTLPLIK